MAFQSFDFERTWRLFQKRVMHTKFNIYVFIIVKWWFSIILIKTSCYMEFKTLRSKPYTVIGSMLNKWFSWESFVLFLLAIVLLQFTDSDYPLVSSNFSYIKILSYHHCGIQIQTLKKKYFQNERKRVCMVQVIKL